MTRPILNIEHLSTCFRTDRGTVTAVDDVSFDVFPGETVGIVGESGCGKTVTSKSIMRLLPPRNSFIKPESRIWFRTPSLRAEPSEPSRTDAPTDPSHAEKVPRIDLAHADERFLRGIRGKHIAMIFQEPMTSLNPVFKIGWQIEEALKYHTQLGASDRRARTIEMLRLVEIPNPEKRIDEYPHQLSGGMRQRVMIAIALCCEPSVLIADEPTTALDVTIQAQILQLMDNLKRRLGTAIVLITHNLGVVAQVCDRVLVMYAGRVIESAPVHELFHAPRHPYTQALLGSITKAGNKQHGKRMPTIDGIVPSLFDLPKGCRFQDRCKFKQEKCASLEPGLESAGDGRLVRCHYPLLAEHSSQLTLGATR